jgi:hypothetical protein
MGFLDTRNNGASFQLRMNGSKWFKMVHMPHGLGKLTGLWTLMLYSLGKKGSSIPKQKSRLGDLDGLEGTYFSRV